MNKKSISIIVCSAALGFCIGSIASKSEDQGEEAEGASYQNAKIGTSRAKRGTSPEYKLPYMKSEGTLETMMSKGADCPAGEFALWLADTSEPDIAAYLDFREGLGTGGGLKRIIMYNWVRADPHAALARTAGTKDEATVYWAWGVSDPEAALAAVSSNANGEKYLSNVINGIGQMQNKWLMKNFHRIPEEHHNAALNGLVNWKENSDQVSKLNFLMKHGRGVSAQALKTLTRQDPWAAYEWLEENGRLTAGGYRRGRDVAIFLDAIKGTDSSVLERMIASTSPGALKRQMENALFSSLLESDPDAAMAQAKAENAPLIAVKMLGEAGFSLLSSDPEKAFGIGEFILLERLEFLGTQQVIEGVNGKYPLRGSGDDTAERFIRSLLVKDPERTMDMAVSNLDTSSALYRQLSEKMSGQDIGSYVEWVNRQSDPKVLLEASPRIVNQYAEEGEFHKAAEWVKSGGESTHGHLYNLAWKWGRSDAGEARAWVESMELDDNLRKGLLSIIER